MKFNYALQEHRHDEPVVNHILDSGRTYDIVKYPGETSFGFLAQEDEDDVDGDAFFRIKCSSWTLEVQALLSDLLVIPGDLVPTPLEPLRLGAFSQPKRVLLLRDGDRISMRDDDEDAVFIVQIAEEDVQVGSSNPLDLRPSSASYPRPSDEVQGCRHTLSQRARLVELQVNSSNPVSPLKSSSGKQAGAAGRGEEGKENGAEVLIQRSFSENQQQQGFSYGSTPQLSLARSELVEDTPAANRFYDASESRDESGRRESLTSGGELAMGRNEGGDDADEEQQRVGMPANTGRSEYFSLQPQPSPTDAHSGGGATANSPKQAKEPVKDVDSGKDRDEEKTSEPPTRGNSEQHDRSTSARKTLDAVYVGSKKRKAGGKAATERARPPSKRARSESGSATDDSEVSSQIEVKPRPEFPSTAATPRRRQRGAVEADESHSQISAASTAATRGPVSVRYKVVCSNSSIGQRPQIVKFLRAHGVSIIESVEEADLLCVGSGELRKTGKLLLAVGLGKRLVSDAWVLASQKAGALLPLPTLPSTPPHLGKKTRKDDNAAADNTKSTSSPADPFLPSDPQREREWRFSISHASGRPRADLLRGCRLYITPALRRAYGATAFGEVEEVARAVGAEDVRSKGWKRVWGEWGTGGGGGGESKRKGRGNEEGDGKEEGEEGGQVIMLACDGNDPDATELAKRGWTAYHRDLLSLSVLRGELATGGGEFEIFPVMEDGGSAKKEVLGGSDGGDGVGGGRGGRGVTGAGGGSISAATSSRGRKKRKS